MCNEITSKAYQNFSLLQTGAKVLFGAAIAGIGTVTAVALRAFGWSSMSTILATGITCAFSTVALASQKNKKDYTLILHVDVNKTIISDDPAGNQSREDVINSLLAEKYKFIWSERVSQPISYYDYVYDYVIPGPRTDVDIKRQRRELTRNFVEFVKSTNHPLKDKVVKDYKMIKEKLENQYIFPSFIRLIKKLREQDINFHVVLRTFGKDSEDVVAEFSKKLPEEKFTGRGHFENGQLHVEGTTIEKIHDIYKYLKSNAYSHLAIKDSFEEWNNHKQQREYGKKFPLNLHDQKVHAIFFDDNIEIDPNSVTNIVAPVNAENGESLPIEDLLQRKMLIQTNTIKAIIDENYFIDVVNESLEASGKARF